MNRRCGGCTLCCRLLPVRELRKGANERCKHQRTGKGCAVYQRPRFPPACGLWSCRWLIDEDCTDLRRPDRSHYVIDIMPDYVTVQDNETGTEQHVPIIQVWVDPAHPDAHRDPALRAYLERQAEREGFAALIRFDADRAIVVFPPSLASDGQWHEEGSGMCEQPHAFADIASKLTKATGVEYAAAHASQFSATKGK